MTYDARGISVSSSALASISTDLRSGWGALAIGAEPSRLSENELRTARSSGDPGRAMKVVLRASSWMLPAALRNCPTYSPPVVYEGLPIRPANNIFSPMPRLVLIDRKNGLSSRFAGISIQVLSSFCQSGNRPSICFASLMTSANGLGAPATGGGAGGVAFAGRACAGVDPGAAVAAAGVGAAVGMADTDVAAGAAFGSGVVAQADSRATSKQAREAASAGRKQNMTMHQFTPWVRRAAHAQPPPDLNAGRIRRPTAEETLRHTDLRDWLRLARPRAAASR